MSGLKFTKLKTNENLFSTIWCDKRQQDPLSFSYWCMGT